MCTRPRKASLLAMRGKVRGLGAGLPVIGLVGRVGTLEGTGAYSANGRRGVSRAMTAGGRCVDDEREVEVRAVTETSCGGAGRSPSRGGCGMPSPVGAASRIGRRENSSLAGIAGGAGCNNANGGASRADGNASSGLNSPAEACSFMSRRSCLARPDRMPLRAFLADTDNNRVVNPDVFV